MSRGKRFVYLSTAVLALSIAGCHSYSARRSIAAEPALSGLDAGDMAVLETPPVRELTVVDRHPLLYKPREYWDNAGENRIVKAAAATLVGVPVGIVGEVRQIVAGSPTATPR